MVWRGGDPVAGFDCVGAHRRPSSRKSAVCDGRRYGQGRRRKGDHRPPRQWRGQITHRATDLAGGYNELQKQFATIINFLLQQGVTAEAVEEGPINASAHYKRDAKGHATSEIESHTLTQTFIVTTTDVALAKRLAKESTQLIREGIAFRSYPPSFYYTKLEGLKLDLLEQAAENAQLRAERLARSSGNRVVNIISASQGIFQITRLNSIETASWCMYDTSTLEKKVRAVVTLR